MRIYSSFKTARQEIARELKEMGVAIQTKTYQDKDIEGNLDYTTRELENYGYVITRPDPGEIDLRNPKWCEAEFAERVQGIYGNPLNPGMAWRLRPGIWEEFLEHGDGTPRKKGEPFIIKGNERAKFSYTYSERFAKGWAFDVVGRLKDDPHSRQLYMGVWNPVIDPPRLGHRRVPCSLGYHFMFRNGALDMTYFMRSCDFGEHFDNDVWMAMSLQSWVAREAGVEPVGRFTHFINSLHVYAHQVADAF